MCSRSTVIASFCNCAGVYIEVKTSVLKPTVTRYRQKYVFKKSILLVYHWMILEFNLRLHTNSFKLDLQFLPTSPFFQTSATLICQFLMTFEEFYALSNHINFQTSNDIQVSTLVPILSIPRQNEKVQSHESQGTKQRTHDAKKCLAVLSYTNSYLNHQLKYFNKF